MEEDFAAKVKRKKTRKIVIGIVLIAAVVILAVSLFTSKSRQVTGGSDTVTVEIRCDQLSNDMDSLNDPALVDYIPDDGTILAETEVKIDPGETSVFDVTDKACFDNNIQIEYSYSPGYDSHYIEGISYIYEFSAGTYSGWMFTVDGKIADYGADKVILNGGEKIRWYYTIDYHNEDYGENDYAGAQIPSQTGESQNAGAAKIREIRDLAINALIEDYPEPACSPIGGEWVVKAVSLSETEPPEGYYDRYYDNLCNTMRECDGILDEVRYTEYERVIIALSAIGKDPHDVAGYDITGHLDEADRITYQGVNSACYALIAAHTAGIKLENEDDYIRFIIEGLSDEKMKKDMSYADYLAFGIEALLNYQDREDAASFVKEAKEILSGLQGEDGSYGSSEATAEVIVALSNEGTDILNDPAFIKNGKTLYDGLMEYYYKDGRFKHLKEDEEANAMGTEKSALALDAICVYEDGGTFY